MRLYERFADKGYHSSIATTFGIDFDAYENIVLPRIRGAGCRNNMVIADRRMLTQAVEDVLALPRQAGRQYTITGAPVSGTFHPKLFLQIGRKGGRLIIGSANLTAAGLAGNLEVITMLTSGTEGDGSERLIARAYQYLSRLVNPLEPMLLEQRDWMLERATWLQYAVPADRPVQLADHTQAALLIPDSNAGIAAQFVNLVEEQVKRLIVLSPYWDERLGALSALVDKLAPKETAVLIDPDRRMFPSDAAENIKGLKIYCRNNFEVERFLHAKVLIAQTEMADHLLIGSANCTTAALGTAGMPGSNSEVNLYRRLPPGRAVKALRLSGQLGNDMLIEARSLPPLNCEDEIALDSLSQKHPGSFAIHGDTLSWYPAQHMVEPEGYDIELLAVSGMPLDVAPVRLGSQTPGKLRFSIKETSISPAFTRLSGKQDFALGIITHVDDLKIEIRERRSRKVENALAQLDCETEATLNLLKIQDLLERIEDDDKEMSGEGVSIPKAPKETEDRNQKHRRLSYEDFIAARRPHREGQALHNGLGGSDVSIVRGFLNRIIGLNTLRAAAEEADEDAIRASFDLGDETENAEAAMTTGEKFEIKTPQKPDEDASLRSNRQRQATRDQLVDVAKKFTKRLDVKREKDALSPRDFLRLRALLMIICAAAYKGTDEREENLRGRTALQVLSVEGDPNIWPWPRIVGYLLHKVFCGSRPAIRSLRLECDHDQLPADVIECWATCFWCLQACLNVSLSQAPRTKTLRDHIDRLVEPVYRGTCLTKDELLGSSISSVMDGMSVQYAGRLGISDNAVSRAHRSTCERIFS